MPDGHGSLWYGSDGNMFGTAVSGGIAHQGYLYSVGQNGIHTTLVQFTGTSGTRPGRLPYAPVVEGNDGILYGTTQGGGANDKGTVYRVWKDGSNFQTLVQFGNHPGWGGYPSKGQLLEGSDGAFYGSTNYEIFRLSPNGALTKLVDFADEGIYTDGYRVATRLVEHADGTLYGTSPTAYNGSGLPCGLIFKITGAQTAAPDMGVTGPNGAAMASGTMVDFGLLPSPGLAVANVVFRNHGSAYLTGLQVTKSGPDANRFGWSNGGSPGIGGTTDLAPGESVTLDISCSANYYENTSLAATIQVTTDDGDTPVFVIPVIARISTDPYALWRYNKFGYNQLANQELSGPAADAEKDGIPNAVEYALGFEPMTNNSTPWLVDKQMVGPDQFLTISFSVSASFPADATLTVEEAPSLEPTAAWTTLATKTGAAAWAASNGGVITQGAPSGGRIPVAMCSPNAMSGVNPRGFLRLRVAVP